MRNLITWGAVAALLLNASGASAQNPIIGTMFTPDPAPYVHDGKVYLFADHDEDDALNFKMKDWILYSSEDMVNWTYLGTPVSTATFKWAQQGNKAWAAQAVERNGKWYWYVCCNTAKGGDALAVAVADSPQGPYRDAIGGPLAEGFSFIDPTVFIDDDGTPYLFWGNKGFWYGKLNDDMVSFADGYKQVPGYTDPESFGELQSKMDWSIGKNRMMTQYEEGPWVTKRNGMYYVVYPAGGVPEYMAYSTAPTIDGPWTFRGRIMDEAKNSFTIHGGNITYKGHDYMFYHNGLLPNGSGFRRSAAVEEFKFNEDGTIPFIPFTEKGVAPVGTINPYLRVEGETMAQSWGVKVDRRAGIDHYVTSIHNGDWTRVRCVDFGEGITEGTKITARCVNFKHEGWVDMHLNRLDGPKIASFHVTAESVKEPITLELKLNGRDFKDGLKGVHDVYFQFVGGDEELFDFDSWQILKPGLKRSRIVEGGGTGARKAVMADFESLPQHTVFMPQDLNGEALPVLVWGNGACTNSPWEHFKFLNEIASHGYLVIATGYYPEDETAYHGDMSTPQQQMESIDWAIAQNSDPASPLYGKINTKAVCAAGMSCGGLQTLFNCADKRITTYMICNSGLFIDPSIAMPNMPMPGKDQLKSVHGPILYMLGGESDIAYTNGMDDFHRIKHVPAYAINYPVGHGGTYRQPYGGEFRFPAVAWLNWQLKGDKQAAKWFTGKKPELLKREKWTLEKNK